jgi:hypothetical protein
MMFCDLEAPVMDITVKICFGNLERSASEWSEPTLESAQTVLVAIVSPHQASVYSNGHRSEL